MTQSKGAIAAAFAAGLAGGGVGGDQIAQQEIDAANGRTEAVQAIVEQLDTQNPTIKSYVRYASEQSVTDVLDSRLPPDRADQLRQLAQDIAADTEQGETVPLNELVQRLAEKTSLGWLTWFNVNFATYLQSQISIGLAVGNLSPDQLVRVSDVTDVMSSMYDVYVVSHNPESEAQWVETLKTLEEVAQEESDRVAKRMAQQ